MPNLKYVVFTDNTFLIFPSDIPHIQAATNVGTRSVRSAGFVQLTSKKDDECGNRIVEAYCFGKSVSLDRDSLPEEDSLLITRSFS